MADYQIVKSSLEISMGIAGYLELVSPRPFNGKTQGKIIWETNDIIQGRSEQTVQDLLDKLQQKSRGWYPHEIERFSQEIKAFEEQRKLLAVPYTKISDRQYDYRPYDFDYFHSLKIIDQELYDRAVKDGFPPDFFRSSYFDCVTFYCLPDKADFQYSKFDSCTFAVCRIHGAQFKETTFLSSEFHSCDLRGVSFNHGAFSHTRFCDCVFCDTAFQSSRLRRCSTINGTMEGVKFHSAILDGTTYSRVTTKRIEGLGEATITFSGATAREIAEQKHAIFKALGVTEAAPKRHKRPSSPER